MRSASLLLLLTIGAHVVLIRRPDGHRALTARLSQTHWRWRKDDGAETKATALAPQDFSFTQPLVPGSAVRLRIAVCNGLDHHVAGIVRLEYRCGHSGRWTTVSDTVAHRDFVVSAGSHYVADGQPVRVSLIRDEGAVRFAGGRFFAGSRRFSDTLAAGAKKEYEWCIVPTETIGIDSVYQFRLSFAGTQGAIEYGSPLPNEMYLTEGTMPDHAGVYRDPAVAAFFDRKRGWIASDGCISVPLSDGRDLWMMGDSYIDNLDTLTGTVGCLFQVRNCALLQPMNNWTPSATSTLIGHMKRVPSLFKAGADDKYLLWPTGGYQYKDTVFVYNSSQKDTVGGLGFTHSGNDILAKMLLPGLQVVGYDPLPDFEGVEFGLGFDNDEPGDYIYTWGIQPAFINCHIVVARFPRNKPSVAWTFWNGKTWDTSIAHIAPVATGASNGSYVAKVRNRYVLVSTEFSVSCDAGTKIYVASSSRLTGPFTANKVLYTIPDNVLGHAPFFYGPAIHPEYINAKNELLITYDINGYSNCAPNCIDNGFNPDYYRPRGLRVPLSLIDAALAH
jgi:hypothetical protein